MKIFAAGMTFGKYLIVLFLLDLFQNGVYGRVLNKRDTDESIKKVTNYNSSPYQKSLLDDFEEKNLEQEILQELNHLSFRKQREIFVDLEKQHEKFNATQKSLVLSESEILSPLNVEELKSIRKTIKASNSSLPAIRNKRTLNLLLNLVARAMGYTLTPNNPDAEWIPRQQPQPSPQPCSTPPPPCRPIPPSTPPPCAMPPTTPPCPGSNALIQTATIPPNQINANTISYPYRPARTIPLFNFAPLPAGIRVPYPPLLQPPAQQRSPCIPQQPSPPLCSTPAPSPPPCSTPASSPPPCSTPASLPPPCSTPASLPLPCSTPAPSPPPCGTTPAPQMPRSCKPTPSPSPAPCGTLPPSPPCGTTPAPSPSPCSTPAPQPPPCNSTPAPKPPCSTTPAPPTPCVTPAPPCTPSPPPCAPSPSPFPCSPPAVPPSKPPIKGSIVLEYDDPVRIEIFSNDKKYLPASGSVYSGDYDDQQQDWHSHFYPSNEKRKNKNDDFEEEEEMQEEHVEEEEEEETPGHLKHYEDEDERILTNREDEEDESETNLSIVKKPIDQEIKKTQRRKATSSKTKSVTTGNVKRSEKEDNKKNDNKEKTQKMKKPKRKKWVRIVKKQRRKTKMDSNPVDSFQVYTSDSEPEGTRISPKTYGKSMSRRAYHSYDISDFSNDSGSQSTEDLEDFKKVTINKKQIHSPDLEKAYEFNINPYVHSLEPEEARRAKLEKAVEKYVEDYVEKQLGQELIKNTGVPKTTVFEFAPKNGPKIQTITTTVAKTSHSGPLSVKAPVRLSTTASPYFRNPNANTHIVKQSNYEQTLKKRGNTYEALTRKF